MRGNLSKIATAALAGAVGAIIFGCTGTTSSGEGASSPSGRKATSKIADFTIETVEGKTVSLSDYVGANKVVMIDFWATWCEPCLAAMPHLNEIYRQNKDKGFVIVSIAMDGPDTVAEVRSYVKRHQLEFPVLLDQESRAVSLYNPKRSAPFSILIGSDGAIISKRDGYVPGDEVDIASEVEEALR